jgi:hypothetical protein
VGEVKYWDALVMASLPMNSTAQVAMPVGGRPMLTLDTLQPLNTSLVGTSENQCSMEYDLSVWPVCGTMLFLPNTVTVLVAMGPSANMAHWQCKQHKAQNRKLPSARAPM